VADTAAAVATAANFWYPPPELLLAPPLLWLPPFLCPLLPPEQKYWRDHNVLLHKRGFKKAQY
jgi:hypothetical protein